jgi:hypothetical protein
MSVKKSQSEIQTATTVPFTPIMLDANNIAVPDNTTQGAILTLAKEIRALKLTPASGGVTNNILTLTNGKLKSSISTVESQEVALISSDIGQSLIVGTDGKILQDISDLRYTYCLKNGKSSVINLAKPSSSTNGNMEIREINYNPASISANLPLIPLPVGYKYKINVTTHARFKLLDSNGNGSADTLLFPIKIYINPFLDDVNLIDPSQRMDTSITTPAGLLFDQDINFNFMYKSFGNNAVSIRPNYKISIIIPQGTNTVNQIEISEWIDIIDVLVVKDSNLIYIEINEDFNF